MQGSSDESFAPEEEEDGQGFFARLKEALEEGTDFGEKDMYSLACTICPISIIFALCCNSLLPSLTHNRHTHDFD
jgi:hypothetical protein